MDDEFDKSNPTRDRGVTRYLGTQPDAKPMPQRPTGPLDEMIPWVIEFRVVGTTHIIQVNAQETIIVGRSDVKRGVVADVDLTPYAAHVLGVSRQHAKISVTNEKITIHDLNSANGTFLNGHVLSPGEEYRLRHGDQISFGQLHLQVQFVVMPASESGDENQPASTGDVEIPVLGNGQKILIVDDDTDVARLIGSILERAGFKVATVRSAEEAVGRMALDMPNAVVLELVLPEMSGMDLARYVRRLETNKHIPMIAVSSATGGFHINQAREAGVDVVLNKPVGVDEIINAMRTIVEQL